MEEAESLEEASEGEENSPFQSEEEDSLPDTEDNPSQSEEDITSSQVVEENTEHLAAPNGVSCALLLTGIIAIIAVVLLLCDQYSKEWLSYFNEWVEGNTAFPL